MKDYKDQDDEEDTADDGNQVFHPFMFWTEDQADQFLSLLGE